MSYVCIMPMFFSQWSSLSYPPARQIDGNEALSLIVDVCFVFSVISVFVSVRLIFQHLSTFTEPIVQRKIIAILWMVQITQLPVGFHCSTSMPRCIWTWPGIATRASLFTCSLLSATAILVRYRDTIDRNRIYAVLAVKRQLQHPQFLQRL